MLVEPRDIHARITQTPQEKWGQGNGAKCLTVTQQGVKMSVRNGLKFRSTQNQRAEMMRIGFLVTALLLIASPLPAQEQYPPNIKRHTPVSIGTADGKYSVVGVVEYFLIDEKKVKVPAEDLTKQMKVVLRVDGKKVNPVLLSRLSDDSIKNLRLWQSADRVRAHQARRLCRYYVSMEKINAALEQHVGSNVCLRSHVIDFDIKPSKDFEGRFSTDLISPSEARFHSSQDPRPTLGVKLAAELMGQFKPGEESIPGDIYGRIIKREDKIFLMIYEINFYRNSDTFRNRTLIKSFKHLDEEEFLDN